MKAATAIQIAAEHAPAAAFRGSAEICVADARKCLERGDELSALRRAADSLRYSVGIFGGDYQAVAAAYKAAEK